MQDRENLLISKALVGRLGNSSATAYKLTIQNVLQHLETKGIREIQGKIISPSLLEGTDWSIDLTPKTKIPTGIHYWPTDKHTSSFRFTNYESNPSASSSQPKIKDTDEPEEHAYCLMINDYGFNSDYSFSSLSKPFSFNSSRERSLISIKN